MPINAVINHQSNAGNSSVEEIFVGSALPTVPGNYKLFVIPDNQLLYKFENGGYVPAYRDVSDSANEIFIGQNFPSAPGQYKLFVVPFGHQLYKFESGGYIPAYIDT